MRKSKWAIRYINVWNVLLTIILNILSDKLLLVFDIKKYQKQEGRNLIHLRFLLSSG